jgi:flagellar biosynthesis/type III secretory pathway M-ring protein FliF/YscJ
MKKYLAVVSIILIILVGVILFFNHSKQPLNYVIFASSQNINAELRETLVNRLETNDIPYQIDNNGNIKISEKDVKKAIICCS